MGMSQADMLEAFPRHVGGPGVDEPPIQKKEFILVYCCINAEASGNGRFSRNPGHRDRSRSPCMKM